MTLKQPKGVRTGGRYIKDPETGKVKPENLAGATNLTDKNKPKSPKKGA